MEAGNKKQFQSKIAFFNNVPYKIEKRFLQANISNENKFTQKYKPDSFEQIKTSSNSIKNLNKCEIKLNDIEQSNISKKDPYDNLALAACSKYLQNYFNDEENKLIITSEEELGDLSKSFQAKLEKDCKILAEMLANPSNLVSTKDGVTNIEILLGYANIKPTLKFLPANSIKGQEREIFYSRKINEYNQDFIKKMIEKPYILKEQDEISNEISEFTKFLLSYNKEMHQVVEYSKIKKENQMSLNNYLQHNDSISQNQESSDETNQEEKYKNTKIKLIKHPLQNINKVLSILSWKITGKIGGSQKKENVYMDSASYIIFLVEGDENLEVFVPPNDLSKYLSRQNIELDIKSLKIKTISFCENHTLYDILVNNMSRYPTHKKGWEYWKRLSEKFLTLKEKLNTTNIKEIEEARKSCIKIGNDLGNSSLDYWRILHKGNLNFEKEEL